MYIVGRGLPFPLPWVIDIFPRSQHLFCWLSANASEISPSKRLSQVVQDELASMRDASSSLNFQPSRKGSLSLHAHGSHEPSPQSTISMGCKQLKAKHWRWDG
jgi:hypothetical protein